MFAFLAGLLFSTAFSSVLAATPGTFEDGGNTKVSAMMMFLGNEDSIYILDKAELNPAQINGHPAWGSLWDIKTRKSTEMDIRTNSFCAAGMHLPNGSFVTFGGNDAVTRDGKPGSQLNPDNTGAWDSFYQDFDGRRSIRIVNPCKITDNLNGGNCMWFDEPEQLAMKRRRWYSTAEATAEGEIVIIGGFINGGYINRWWPNDGSETQRGQSEPTYEYFPPRDGDPRTLQFIVRTAGLNAYPHTFLMPSGKMLLQANLSTILWDHVNNAETPLPDMPKGVIRVYPASGATAMLPLTPANNWTATILFCGGSTIADQDWGDYAGPAVDTWTVEASKDCQRLTAEPLDGSQPRYEQDDDMVEPRTMGQFIILPTGKLLILNGGQKGTAGYAVGTKNTPDSQMPFGRSLASEPVLRPVIYDPDAPKGSRWSTQGLSASKIPRLYHSSAMLLPDGSVIVAGSNPNPDVNMTTVFPTEYRADVFFPPYFSSSVRPSPQNLPTKLSYGGPYFNINIPLSSFSGSPNDAAEATKVAIVRGGFTTHAMNMGQRFMQLNNTYTVNKNGTFTLHVSQLPPNPNLFQPGPVLLYVVVNGIPSVGKLVIIGNGNIGAQPTAAASVLPASVRVEGATFGSNNNPDPGSVNRPSTMLILAAVAGGCVLLALVGFIILVIVHRKRRAAALLEKGSYPLDGIKPLGGPPVRGMHYSRDSSATDATVFAPLTNQKGYPGGAAGEGEYHEAWDSSTANLHAPYSGYKDDGASSMSRPYSDYDPYAAYAGVPQQNLESTTSLPAAVGGGDESQHYNRSAMQSFDELPPSPQQYGQQSYQTESTGYHQQYQHQGYR